MSFLRSTALVTGAARGIGLAIVERLLRAGARVALVDRDIEAVKAAAARLGPGATAIVADVTVTADVDGLRTTIGSGFAQPDHIRFDPVGNLFVADFGANRIYAGSSLSLRLAAAWW